MSFQAFPSGGRCTRSVRMRGLLIVILSNAKNLGFSSPIVILSNAKNLGFSLGRSCHAVTDEGSPHCHSKASPIVILRLAEESLPLLIVIPSLPLGGKVYAKRTDEGSPHCHSKASPIVILRLAEESLPLLIVIPSLPLGGKVYAKRTDEGSPHCHSEQREESRLLPREKLSRSD